MKYTDLLVRLFLLIATMLGGLWLALFSGIDWMADGFVASVGAAALTLAENWGPLFAPCALIVFMIRSIQKNIVFEVLNHLQPQLERAIDRAVLNAVKTAVSQQQSPRIFL